MQPLPFNIHFCDANSNDGIHIHVLVPFGLQVHLADEASNWPKRSCHIVCLYASRVGFPEKCRT